MGAIQNVFSTLISWITDGIPLSNWVDIALDFLIDKISWLTRALSGGVEAGIEGLVSVFLFPHWIVVVLIITGLAVFFSWKDIQKKLHEGGSTKRSFGSSLKIVLKGNGLAFFTFFGLLLIINLGLWEQTMQTLALVLVSTIIAVFFGVPIGILAALNSRFYQFVKPLLDFMQTMPAFVYLIPAIPFFGLGPVSAAFATVVFSIPPAIPLDRTRYHSN
jgi:glycine betaine/proline transport system permease protein